LAALKLTRANAQNIIFVAEIWEKKLNIINAEIWENNAEIVFPAQTIHMLLKIPATHTPQGALKCVALIIKILSCNKKKKFMVYDQNYHNCSTLCSLEVDVKNKTVARPFGTRANKQTNKL
jgi:hypothetical protein